MGNLHISLIQTDLFWEDKFRNLEMLEKKIARVEAATQIVVLPEMFTTGFSMQPKLFAETMEGPTVGWMIEQAALHKIIVTGSVIIEEDNKFYTACYGYYLLDKWLIIIKDTCLHLLAKTRNIQRAIKD